MAEAGKCVVNIFAAALLMVFAVTPLHAQLLAGIDGGLTLNHMSYAGYYYYDASDVVTSTDAIARLTLGVRVEYEVDYDMRIVSGLRFNQRGGHYTISDLGVLEDYLVEYDYLEIPLGVKLLLTNAPVRLYIGMNAVAAVNIRAESRSSTTSQESVVDYSEFARNVLPFVDFLGGMEIPLNNTFNVLIEARYSQNILSIDDSGPTNIYASGFMFTAGLLYSFTNNSSR